MLELMKLDRHICYRALQTRDARFDGHFFTAVLTTKIYCRPICPARIPDLKNCLFVPSAAAANSAGFRPCLRCHPEIAPSLRGRLEPGSTVFDRALSAISAGALDESGVKALADRLAVSDRHLRRLFSEHLGASPIMVAQTRPISLDGYHGIIEVRPTPGKNYLIAKIQSSDLALLRAMTARDPLMTKAKLTERAEAWRPWRAYAAMYLWSS
jgi:methylphosphotriester-DNA--protein-cysteine methyltransferase